MLEGYLLSALAGGGWMVQILLERNGKEQDAKIPKAIGYGAVFALAVRLGQELIGIIGVFRLW
jgi:hypothetical protein